MTSVSLHPTSHRGGRAPPPRRCRGKDPSVRGALPDFFFLTLRSPLPRASRLRRDASAGLLPGRRLGRDAHERAESRRQSHRDVPPSARPSCSSRPACRRWRAAPAGRPSPRSSPVGTEPRSRPGPNPSRMVKCPLCAAVLQQPRCVAGRVRGMPTRSSRCRGRTTGERATARELGVGVADASERRACRPSSACPSCQMRLQPPPGAPLVACGGCRQVHSQVPGVAQS